MYTRSAVLAPPTYVGLGRFQHGPETMFQMGVTQIWYLVSVTLEAVCGAVQATEA
jgi:hypothetical protein